MPEIDWNLLAGLSMPSIYLAAGAGAVWALWWERRHSSSYTRRAAQQRAAELAAWRREPAVVQEARDTAVLDAAEAAEDAARRAAEKTPGCNAQFRP